MIGASNSPMSMFGSLDTSGPSMYQIGYNGGPGGAINAALNSTIDKYHQTLDAQQQQQNRMDLASQENTNKSGLLDKEYALKTDFATKLLNQKQSGIPVHQLTSEEAKIDPLHPEDPRFMRNVGEVKDARGNVTTQGIPMYPQAIRDKYGNILGYKYVNPRALTMMDMFNGGSSEGGTANEDEAAQQSLDTIRQLQAQLPEGM